MPELLTVEELIRVKAILMTRKAYVSLAETYTGWLECLNMAV